VGVYKKQPVGGIRAAEILAPGPLKTRFVGDTFEPSWGQLGPLSGAAHRPLLSVVGEPGAGESRLIPDKKRLASQIGFLHARLAC
jgi:hypothetical protein